MSLRSKEILALLLAAIMAVSLCSCGSSKNTNENGDSHQVVLDLFASNNSVLAVTNLVDRYQRIAPNTAIRVTYDKPAMLAAKIEAGYECDMYICEDPQCMDWLDGTKSGDANPNKNNCLESDTRKAVFTGLPEGIVEFEDFVFEVAMTKNTTNSDEVLKFIDFISGEQADAVYEGSGFTRIQ